MDIKGVIKAKGYTIEAVAEQMGISAITLHQNIARNPTIKTLHKIADVIGVSVGEFFADELNTTIKCPYCGKPIKVKLE